MIDEVAGGHVVGKHGTGRSDRGATRLETALIGGVLAALVVGGAALVGIEYFDVVDETHHATVSGGRPFAHSAEALEPVTVNVVAAATIVEPAAPADPDADACPGLRGTQPAPFDCGLPLFADALDTVSSGVTGRYGCADRINYQVVGGQAAGARKQCILKTAAGS